jgi:hypothetical protein
VARRVVSPASASISVVTVALFVKVFDGIVLATDSATTFRKKGLLLQEIHQVYNNADKIFHLHRQLPIAAMTFGMGAVGPASISSLSKSFRTQLMGRDPNYKYPLDINNFTVQDVAERAARMFAQAATDAGLPEWPNYPDGLGYIVAGISSDCDQAEVWLLKFEGSPLEPVPEQVFKPEDYGHEAYAQPGPVDRLFNGYDDSLRNALIQNEIRAGKTAAEAENNIDTFLGNLRLKVKPVQDGMPLPDAITLARFMVETTEGYARFQFGPDTVGGEVEVASISPHEGFKWINRKHYYDPALNPGEQP